VVFGYITHISSVQADKHINRIPFMEIIVIRDQRFMRRWDKIKTQHLALEDH
jgi:hypothetical protein